MKQLEEEKNKKKKEPCSATDVALKNFAAAAVKDSLKLGLIQLSMEEEVCLLICLFVGVLSK